MQTYIQNGNAMIATENGEWVRVKDIPKDPGVKVPKMSSEELLNRLNDTLRNALYWTTEQPALEQAAGALLEARGIAIRLAEKEVKYNIPLFRKCQKPCTPESSPQDSPSSSS